MSPQALIGLEIHVQLSTRTKLFCRDRTAPAPEPNSNVCPVCLGLPGALPVLNAAAVEFAVRAALGLDCTVNERSTFDRKTYFYPDLPKGYQITQAAAPLACDGEFEGVRIGRLHLEEDSGRLLHDRFEGLTAIDLDRAGVPLIEIVTTPDLNSPTAARQFLVKLRRTLRYLDVSECDMENGTLRVDANVSLGTEERRTELKNLNSFAYLERALTAEIERQRGIVTSGKQVASETLSWDAVSGTLRVLRAKERPEDYRYLPDPDLPPVVVSAAAVSRIRASLPELPAARSARLEAAYDLPRHDVEVLTAERALADYFEATAARVPPGEASKWIRTDVLRWLNRRGSDVDSIPVAPADLADLIRRVERGVVSRTAARAVFERMADFGVGAEVAIAELDAVQVSDDAQLSDWIDRTVAAHAPEVDRYRSGDRNVMQYLMGQLMRISGGKADPRAAAALLRARLEA